MGLFDKFFEAKESVGDAYHDAKYNVREGVGSAYDSVRHTAVGDRLAGTRRGPAANRGHEALGKSVNELGDAVGDSLKAKPPKGPRMPSNAIARGASAPIRAVAKFFRHSPLAGGVMVILGGGALAYKLAGGKSTASEGDMSIEDMGRQDAQVEFINGAQKAEMDVNNAIQQQMMMASPSPKLSTIGGAPSNVAMADTALYQGRMQQPRLEQSLS
ncbi:MAG: hypothetical protein MRY32_00355 [Rickettsiales bacterium]|nr:hypothetical protein [Rickettsiales bacterium]